MSTHPDPLAEVPPESYDVAMGAADPHPDPDDDLGIEGFDDEDEIMRDRVPAPHLDAEAVAAVASTGKAAGAAPPASRGGSRPASTGGGGGGSW